MKTTISFLAIIVCGFLKSSIAFNPLLTMPLSGGAFQFESAEVSAAPDNPNNFKTDTTCTISDSCRSTNVSCYGGNNGTAGILAIGGAHPYTYHWSSGQTTSSISSLTAGIYSVTITDSLGCTATCRDTITQPDSLIDTLSGNMAICLGTDTMISLGSAVSGGVSPYTYSWTGPDSFSSTSANPTIHPVSTSNSGTYSLIITDSHGCTQLDTIHITVDSCFTVNLSLFIEGYYLGSSIMQPVLQNELVIGATSTQVDHIIVELHNTTSPFGIVQWNQAMLMTNGQATTHFTNNYLGSTKYIAIKHRNAIQTWSGSGVTLSSTPYDFSTGASQAYGSNMRNFAGVYAFYSGDINQDGNVDILDFPPLDQDINNGLSGYYATDLNGDGNVDLLDFPILDNNINLGITSYQP